MKLSAIKQTIKWLYEGQRGDIGFPLAPNVSFEDPVLIVRGRTRVLKMFRRLNTVFPNASIERFQPVAGSSRRFEMEVQYKKRSFLGRRRPFRTIIELEIASHGVVKITEHWSAPFSLTAEAKSPLVRIARRGLGRLITTGRKYAD